jgi:hypothetical protein
MIVNEGNILPFYTRKSDQWVNKYGHNRFGILAQRTKLIPFQVYTNGIPTTFSFEIYDTSDTLAHTISVSKIDEHCQDTTRKWFTYNSTTLSTTLDCGWYYIKATFDGTSYYSEVLHVVEDSQLQGVDDMWKFKATHSADIGTLLYSEGYVQWAWLECLFDYPEILRDTETQINGSGNEILLSSVTTERGKFQSPRFIDHWRYIFKRFEDHDTLTLRYDGAQAIEYDLDEYLFEPLEDADQLFTKGEISYKAKRYAFNGCSETLSVVDCSTA